LTVKRKEIGLVHPAQLCSRLLRVYVQYCSTIQYGIVLYNFPQQLCIQMFEGWLQCGLCERWDLYSIYSSPWAWIISDFGSVRNVASISHLTFILHCVQDECLSSGAKVQTV